MKTLIYHTWHQPAFAGMTLPYMAQARLFLGQAMGFGIFYRCPGYEHLLWEPIALRTRKMPIINKYTIKILL